MLPKPEKNKKNSVSVEQLSLTVDPVKKENNLKRKRLYVGITLSLTVILSLSFSIYRYFKNNDFNLKLPTLTQKKDTSSSINKDIENIVGSEKNIWYIFAQDLNSTYSFDWSQNKQDFVTDSAEIDSGLESIRQSNTNSHNLDNLLPGGVSYIDSKTDINGDLVYLVLLTVPKKQIYSFIKISNGASLDQSIIDPKIASVVETIYWHIINL